LYELNRLDEAEHALRDALVRDPGRIEIKELLAFVLAGLDRYDESLALVRETIARNPDALSSRVVLAGVLSEAGRFDEALEEATGAAATASTDPRPHHVLGVIHVRMNAGLAAFASFEDMARYLEPDLAPRPGSDWVWYHWGCGTALSLQGRHDEAMTAFDTLLRVDPAFYERWPEFAPHYQRSAREIGRS
jgi:tetratricopeptide (TPR) repeat protein